MMEFLWIQGILFVVDATSGDISPLGA